MAVAFKSSGSGVATETSGAALSPACPATVDAGDILIAHVYWEGTSDAPSTPANWTLLSGPHVIESTIARHWVFGKIADGTEDGATVAFGSPAVTTQRGARIYSFSGRTGGTITQLTGGFSHISHANDPQGPSVTTPQAGALAIALVGQNDNNAQAAFTGQSGGTWAEAVAEFTANLTPGLALQLCTCTPTSDPGTVSGGSNNTTNDPVGTIGFWIRADIVTTSSTADSGSYSVSGAAAEAVRDVPSVGGSGSYSVSGSSATDQKDVPSNAETGAYSVSGADATGTRDVPAVAGPGSYSVSGADADGSVALGGSGTTSVADPGSYAVSGVDASDPVSKGSDAAPGSYSVSGAASTGQRGYLGAADPGSYVVAGAEATGISTGPQAIVSNAAPGSYAVAGVEAESSVRRLDLGTAANPAHLQLLWRRRRKARKILVAAAVAEDDEDPLDHLY